MKKSAVSVFPALAVAFAISGIAQVARADIREPIWTCALEFNAQGGGVQVFVGDFSLEGPGTIQCVDTGGHRESIEVNVKMGGRHFSPTIAVAPYLRVKGVASGIGLNASPQTLLGDYVVASVNGAIGEVGAGAVLGLHGARNALDFDVALQWTQGLGFQAGIETLEISPR